MKYWYTEITAIDPQSNKLLTYQGPIAKGETIMDAEKFCSLNCPYACVIGEIVRSTADCEEIATN